MRKYKTKLQVLVLTIVIIGTTLIGICVVNNLVLILPIQIKLRLEMVLMEIYMCW